MTEDEWSLILAETPGLKRIIEENEAFRRAQFWGLCGGVFVECSFLVGEECRF